MNTRKYTYFIGIDVSRNELDYAIIYGKKFLFHKEALNDLNSIKLFLSELKALPNFTITKSVFCMENTGIYCNHLLTYLKKIKANIALENALHIKNSLGLIRGKHDKIDSIRIAHYAEKNRDDLRLWIPRRPIIDELAMLLALRNRIISLQVVLKVPLKEQTTFIDKKNHNQSVKLCQNSVDAIGSDLKEINLRLDMIIKSDAHLNHLFDLASSVPNVGKIAAIQIIISTNEFKDISNPKKFACYAGIAPFSDDSGVVKKKAKVSAIANKKVKSLLHICALSAISHNGEFKDYYLRRTKIDGKAKMSVVNAVRNKLILRVFSCVKQDRKYEYNYLRPDESK